MQHSIVPKCDTGHKRTKYSIYIYIEMSMRVGITIVV